MPILQWLNKDEAVTTAKKSTYRLLKEVPELSYGDKAVENMLIQGDNLEALKALIPYYAGQVKCIYIDPPYNTQKAFDYYDDNLEHSTWLSLLYPRIELLHELLAEDGFFCCQIDDSESHYLKVILDEIFGRKNYITTFFMQVRYGNKTLAEDNDYQKVIEQCFIYAKNSSKAKANKNKEPYKVEKFEWEITEISEGEELELAGKRVKVFKPGQYEIKKVPPHLKGLKETWATGSLVRQTGSSGEFLDKNLAPRKNIDGLSCLYKVYGIGEDGLGYRYMTGPKKATATKGKFYSGIPLQTLADIHSGNSDKEKPIENLYDFAGDFGNCRHEGGVDFGGGKKPEKLLGLILKYFSNEGDLVLDSFLGSGGTAATALKMNRRFIGVEIGEHAKTHCSKRLKSVVDGEQTGISSQLNWQGGGGFKFYELGEAVFNEYGSLNHEIKFPTLAAHIWFLETKTPIQIKESSPFLGIHNGNAYYLLYNGILGDRRPQGGNVLTSKVLNELPNISGHEKIVIYGESSRLGEARLKQHNITFKQIPYDVGSI